MNVATVGLSRNSRTAILVPDTIFAPFLPGWRLHHDNGVALAQNLTAWRYEIPASRDFVWPA